MFTLRRVQQQLRSAVPCQELNMHRSASPPGRVEAQRSMVALDNRDRADSRGHKDGDDEEVECVDYNSR
jgi:hypothetical protein